jgi:hypothetical protein
MSVIDFSETIIAKSDQLNAADIAGSITIKITDAKQLETKDQPVHIFYEGGGNRPWKPCLTMCRVMALVWGSKVDLKGRQITLICDPTVTWGGAEVGGIRLTHMSHMPNDKQVVIPVRVSRHKVAKYTVLPLKTTDSAPKPEQTPEAPQELLEAGESAASQGVESYKAWLTTLDEEIKPLIRHKHTEWTAIAKQADADEELPL